MKKTLLLFTLLLTPLFSQIQEGPRPHPYDYTLSVAAIFQKEARFLKEWVEYHVLVGVEHFYLYNNSSDDNYLEVLQPYIDWGIVELFDYPSATDKMWTNTQVRAMQDAIKRARQSSRWLAMIDIDEFLVPTEGVSLLPYLHAHEDYSQIVIPWRMFGTSFVEKIPDGTLLIDALTLREAFLPGRERLTKTITKPQSIEHLYIHRSFLYPERIELVLSDPYDPAPPLVIHHYWTRDIAFLTEVKKERQTRVWGKEWTDEELEEMISRYNEVEDTSLQRFSPILRKSLFGR